MIARWIAPEGHGGWPAYRLLFAGAALWHWGARWPNLTQGYSSAGILVEAGPLPLARWLSFSPALAWTLYGTLLLALVAVGLGRLTRPALTLFLVAHVGLNGMEGLHVGLVDNLLMWHAVLLAFTPANASALSRRAVVMLVAAAHLGLGLGMIASTADWWTGEPMALYLVHPILGGGPLAAWVGAQPALVRGLSWLVLGTTLSWPLLVLIPPLRLILLALTVLLHLALALTLDLGGWSAALLCAGPVLVPATTWRRWALRSRGPDGVRRA